MKKILKYAKPHIPLILVAIVLLFGQANADLALPDYLSKIVNTGIQQGGVEDPAPIAISNSTMERCKLFMNETEKDLVLSKYTAITNISNEYEDYLEDYPLLENESVFIQNKLKSSELDELNPIMAKTIMTVSIIENLLNNASLAGNITFGLGFNVSAIPEGMDVFTILGNLPQANRTEIVDMVTSEFNAIGEMVLFQAAINSVRQEYTKLGMDTDQIQTRYVIIAGVWMLLLTLASVTCTISVALIASRTAATMGKEIRHDLFERVESFASAEFDQFSTSSLITRTTNDITQVQMVTVLVIRMVFYAPIMGIGGVIRAQGKAPSLSWIIGLAVLVLICVIITVFIISVPKFKINQKLIDRLNLVARENLSGMMVIRAFNMQEFEENRFDKANVDLTAVSLFINRVMVVLMPVMMLVMNGLVIAIIWQGAHEVADFNMQVGDMMAFMQYAMQIVMSFLMLTMLFIFLPRSSVSIGRIEEVLKTKPTIIDKETPEELPSPLEGVIEFRDVSFKYPGAEQEVLQNISFTAKPGETTAFIGSTGSGKSTVVNLIPRFYDVTSGKILVDRKNIRDVDQHALRDNIGYVPQKSLLFSGTIESNLRYADENASTETIQIAIEVAQAKEFVSSKPEGIASTISQGGSNVSGGQKQRLSIARALVKGSQILILDDSVSALDFKTDAALRRALKETTKNTTLLIVTQRISTVMNAEQIIVMDEGRIVGKGTHKDLLKTCSTYQEIAQSQLALEELA
ncbi:Vitamin B12 import ATP-binding protein BtuD [Candidatus Lokiarchaeum ossiferum]|uniref:Vitamin B12 import ATP-binding protein BtuD n=1 Tax=Candidatus Lokiarchaeum ossiferum TaxID=2951803 RepID=A0ABY6HSZ4_9ARCH|nr:Vitamin B12 import ATP-binding protein BtuD [Candidatus Lokiarchaeum sp. B-35]